MQYAPALLWQKLQEGQGFALRFNMTVHSLVKACVLARCCIIVVHLAERQFIACTAASPYIASLNNKAGTS